MLNTVDVQFISAWLFNTDSDIVKSTVVQNPYVLPAIYGYQWFLQLHIENLEHYCAEQEPMQCIKADNIIAYWNCIGTRTSGIYF